MHLSWKGHTHKKCGKISKLILHALLYQGGGTPIYPVPCGQTWKISLDSWLSLNIALDFWLYCSLLLILRNAGIVKVSIDLLFIYYYWAGSIQYWLAQEKKKTTVCVITMIMHAYINKDL